MSRNILNKIRQASADLISAAQSAKQPDFSEVVAFTKESPMLAGGLAGAGMTLLLGSVGLLDGYYFPGGYMPHDTTALRIGSVLLSGVSGFALGWLFSDRAKVFRAFVLGGVAGIAAIATVADHGALGWASASTLSIGCFLAGFGYWFGKATRRFMSPPTTFGSASWATMSELEAGDVLTDEGFRLGFTENGLPLSYTGNRHMLTIAPNRSGKGTTVIIPNLLTWEGSVMVIDPKGENAMMTAKRRRAIGQKVYIVDPWGITGDDIARINPLDWLQSGDVDIGDNAMLLADAIIVASSHDRFWDEEAKGLLVGVLIFVATDPSEKGHRHLGRVRDLLLLDGEDLKKLFQRMEKSPHHMVHSTGARCLQKEERLLSNVMASVQAQTHFLDSPRLRDSLSASDFSFADLKAERMSVYLVLPSDRLNSHGRWLRLLLQQALAMNARNIEQMPEKSTLFILDEMAAIGKLSMVEQAFGLMAGYGMQLHGVVQDASQLKRIYGDGWETFVSNAGVVQYFGSRDRMTAEYFSALCGVTTVWNFSTAVARAFSVSRGKDTTSSSSTTETETVSGTQRKLAHPDELMRLSQHNQLLLIDNMNPVIASKRPWFDDPDLRDLGVNLHAGQ